MLLPSLFIETAPIVVFEVTADSKQKICRTVERLVHLTGWIWRKGGLCFALFKIVALGPPLLPDLTFSLFFFLFFLFFSFCARCSSFYIFFCCYLSIFRTVGISSWNIRGMGDPIKRATVFSELESYGAGLIRLQETHMTKVSKSSIRNKKFQAQFHSVYSSYSRGVSILVKKGVAFSCRDVRIDTLGCYFFCFV